MTKLTETHSGGPIGAGSSKSGTGLEVGVYQIIPSTKDDWVEFDDFTEVVAAIVTNRRLASTKTVGTTAGTINCFVSGVTANAVLITSVGIKAGTTANILVFGTPA